jgi:hypothetical protein
MRCPHCEQRNGMYLDYGIVRCAICGYWNDPRYPLRYIEAQGEIDILERGFLGAIVSEITGGSEQRWGMHKCHSKEYNRTYKREWARRNADEINRQRRDRRARLHG